MENEEYLQRILSEPIVSEAKYISKLQQIILDSNNDNFEENLDYLLSSNFVASKERVLQIAHIICACLDISIHRMPILVNLTLSISKHLREELFDVYKSYFLNNFMITKIGSQTGYHFARFKFTRLLVDNKFFEIQEINEKIKYSVEFASHQTELHFFLLLWFADFIYQDQDLFKKMSREASDMSKSHFPKTTLQAYRNFTKMEKNKNFDQIDFLAKNGYEKNSIQYLIKSDMLEEFSFQTSSQDIDFYKIVPDSFYEIHDIIHLQTSYVAFAAFYGAIRIFKYIMTDTSQKFVKSNYAAGFKPLIYYGICGGNFEIIRYILNNSPYVFRSPKYAAQFFRYDIFEWLKDDKGANFSSVMHVSCKANNVSALMYTIGLEHPVNQVIHGYAPIHYAAINGNCDCLRILLSHDNIDVNLKNSDGVHMFIVHKTALHFAVLSKNIDAVKLLISDPNISINIQDQAYHSPLHLAVREIQEDIVKLLLDDPRIMISIRNIIFFNFL
ncbi:hypothetical protein TRFO_15479 [Tritrichomonas foetus]|uniref:Uncharacterized protein n=1 Tax=Tritrichomonas foetus TaxID=1144522 RepID=A0A1J4KSC1_9EUKA|nr:hypothetical protein TRFO_15479 [Tritrichomonas foetus]|eukprot:OHT14193.1 hypothetical protein TRFO_15479 [Tritrichomonas foetus]